jgi:ABC-2 type transport system ATP-binding protein
MLSLRGLGKDYGTRTAVKALDLEVSRGECFGLLGPNGAGKTTTISMICGVLTPSRGSVTIDGADVHADPYVAKARLGLVPQELALYEELTPVQNLRYAGALYGLAGPVLAERIRWVLDVVGLANRARDSVTTFSGGMKRRLNLAAGLLHQPQLLVLDEPTVGVDAQSRRHISDTVRSLQSSGTTILYTSHYFEEVESLCDRVAILDGGELVANGAVTDVIERHGGPRVVVETRGGNLESAFLRLTGHALRDEA